MSKIKLIAIIGKSASGKDYLFRQTCKYNPDLNKVIHYTTRPRRPGETNGVDYIFVTEEELTNLSKEAKLFTTTCFNDWYYAIGIDSFNKDKINIGVFNPFEIIELIEEYSDEFDIKIIEMYAEEAVRYTRSLKRLSNKPFDEEGLKEMCRRDKADAIDFKIIEKIPRRILYGYENYSEYNQGYMTALVEVWGNLD